MKAQLVAIIWFSVALQVTWGYNYENILFLWHNINKFYLWF